MTKLVKRKAGDQRISTRSSRSSIGGTTVLQVVSLSGALYLLSSTGVFNPGTEIALSVLEISIGV